MLLTASYKIPAHAFAAAIGANKALAYGTQIIHIPIAVSAGTLTVHIVIVIHHVERTVILRITRLHVDCSLKMRSGLGIPAFPLEDKAF